MYDFVHLVMFDTLNSNSLDLLDCKSQTFQLCVQLCAKGYSRQPVELTLGSISVSIRERLQHAVPRRL